MKAYVSVLIMYGDNRPCIVAFVVKATAQRQCAVTDLNYTVSQKMVPP